MSKNFIGLDTEKTAKLADSLNDLLANYQIFYMKDVSNGKEAMENIVESFAKMIGKQRDLLNLAGEAEDEGTVALMSDYISEQEKTVWMYRSYLGH